MGRARTILEAARRNAANVAFNDLVFLAEAAGFAFRRQSGSHRIHRRPGVPEIINLQRDGSRAKPYQVRQLIELIDRYGIGIA